MSPAKQQERRILVAVDGGEESLNALRWCLQHKVDDSPGSPDALILLYVIPAEVVYTNMTKSRSGYLFSRDVIQALQQYGTDVADSVLSKAKAACSHLRNVKVQTRTEKGDAGEVICGMTAKLGADLLVMGNHDYGVIKRAFLGSVSKYCSKKAKCPVFVVKRPKRGQTSDEVSAMRFLGVHA